MAPHRKDYRRARPASDQVAFWKQTGLPSIAHMIPAACPEQHHIQLHLGVQLLLRRGRLPCARLIARQGVDLFSQCDQLARRRNFGWRAVTVDNVFRRRLCGQCLITSAEGGGASLRASGPRCPNSSMSCEAWSFSHK